MRSNKEYWLRGGAGLAVVAVLACAAYALVNFTRKDWRDFTPVEKIGYFTPDRIRWGPGPVLRYPPLEIVTAEVSGPLGSFVLVWPNAGPDQRPSLARVGADSLQLEVAPDSEIARAIDACLVRGIASAAADSAMRVEMARLRARLTQAVPKG